MWPEAARVLGHGLIVLLHSLLGSPPAGGQQLGSKNRLKTPTTLKLRGKLNGVRPGLPPELAFNRYKRSGGQPIHTYIQSGLTYAVTRGDLRAARDFLCSLHTVAADSLVASPYLQDAGVLPLEQRSHSRVRGFA